MDSSILVPFASLIAGGLLQFLFARVTAKENHTRDMRRQLYASFVETFWKAVTIKEESTERDDILREYAQFSTQISLYGSPKVLKYLASVLKRPDILTDEDKENWKNLICAMRTDVGEKVDGETGDSVRDILFDRGSEIPA